MPRIDIRVATTHDLETLLANLREDEAKLDAAYSGAYEQPQEIQDTLLMDLDHVSRQIADVWYELERRRG
jgi:hypothetical protein